MTPDEASTGTPEAEIGNARLVAEAPRWRVMLPVGSLKGIPELDARRIARENGGTVEKSWVRLYSDGVEVLGPWTPIVKN